MSPWSDTKKFIFLSTGFRTFTCYFHSSQSTSITLPLEEGPFNSSIQRVIISAPFSGGTILHGKNDLRRNSHFGLVCLCFFRMLLPSPSKGYYNPSVYHPGFHQRLIYYSRAYIVWEEGAFTCGGRFGVSPYSSSRILACWDQSLHRHLIYILVCTCIDFSYFIASPYFSRAHICMQLHACKVRDLISYLIKE